MAKKRKIAIRKYHSHEIWPKRQDFEKEQG